MIGATSRAGRYLHIVGTKGEIFGTLEDDKFTLRRFERENYDYYDEIIDLSVDLKENSGVHSGGDFAIVNEFLRYLGGDTSSISITDIDDSINSHFVVYAADKSSKTLNAVDI